IAVVHIAVDPAVIVLVSPDGAGKSADDRTGDRAFKDADARNKGAGARAERATDGSTGYDAAYRRIIALRLTGIIIAVVGIAVDMAVVVCIRPDSADKTAARATAHAPLDDADTPH